MEWYCAYFIYRTRTHTRNKPVIVGLHIDDENQCLHTVHAFHGWSWQQVTDVSCFESSSMMLANHCLYNKHEIMILLPEQYKQFLYFFFFERGQTLIHIICTVLMVMHNTSYSQPMFSYDTHYVLQKPYPPFTQYLTSCNSDFLSSPILALHTVLPIFSEWH